MLFLMLRRHSKLFYVFCMQLLALNNLSALCGKEIIIGSTCMLTPRDFVLEVCDHYCWELPHFRSLTAPFSRAQ